MLWWADNVKVLGKGTCISLKKKKLHSLLSWSNVTLLFISCLILQNSNSNSPPSRGYLSSRNAFLTLLALQSPPKHIVGPLTRPIGLNTCPVSLHNFVLLGAPHLPKLGSQKVFKKCSKLQNYSMSKLEEPLESLFQHPHFVDEETRPVRMRRKSPKSQWELVVEPEQDPKGPYSHFRTLPLQLATCN